MPFTENSQSLETSKGLVERLHAAAGGLHAGFRPGMSYTSSL
jgi:catalase